jgi:hypothetical protein
VLQAIRIAGGAKPDELCFVPDQAVTVGLINDEEI